MHRLIDSRLSLRDRRSFASARHHSMNPAVQEMIALARKHMGGNQSEQFYSGMLAGLAYGPGPNSSAAGAEANEQRRK